MLYKVNTYSLLISNSIIKGLSSVKLEIEFRVVETDAVAFSPSLMVEPGLLKEKVTPENNTQSTMN